MGGRHGVPLGHEDWGRRLRRAGAAVVGVIGGGYAVKYVSQAVIARQLGLEGYGCWRLGFATAMLVAIGVSVGLPSALVRVIPRRVAAGKPVGAVLSVAYGVVFVVGVAVVGLAEVGLRGRVSSCYMLLAPMVLGLAILRVNSGLGRAAGFFALALGGTELGPPLLEVIAVVLSRNRGWSLGDAAMLYGVLLVVAGVAHLGLILAIWNRKGGVKWGEMLGDWASMWQVVRLGGVLVAIEVVNTLMVRVDLLMLGGLRGIEDVSRYSVASQVSVLAGLPFLVYRIAIGPDVSRYYAAGEVKAFASGLKRASQVVFFAVVAGGGVLVVAAPMVLGIFGSAYSRSVEANRSLMLLVAGQALTAAFGPVGSFLSLTRLERDALVLNYLALGANVALNLLLIPHWGATGAAAATVIAGVGWRFSGSIILRRRLGITCHVG